MQSYFNKCNKIKSKDYSALQNWNYSDGDDSVPRPLKAYQVFSSFSNFLNTKSYV